MSDTEVSTQSTQDTQTTEANTQANAEQIFDRQEQLTGDGTKATDANTTDTTDTTGTTDTADTSTAEANVNGEGTVMLITDADNADKLDTITGAALEMSEEDIIAAMSSGDEIRDSQTVPTGRYVVELQKIRLDKDVKFVYTADADGNPKPVREKSVGLRYKILYDVDNKQAMNDTGYQMYHLANKLGEPFASGMTDYKRICANAVSAALNDPAKDMKHVLKFINDKKIPPAIALNQFAASTDDNKHYFISAIKEVPPQGEFQASNELIIGSLKHDGDYYVSVMGLANDG